MIMREGHVMLVLGLLMEQARDLVLNDAAIGLRPSQLRVIDMVPDDGITVTDLARRVGMTKQGIGQFVAQLVDEGYLIAEVDSEDRRLRVVRRTPLGSDASRQLARVLADLETRWAEQIGAQSYRDFRGVLDQLAAVPFD